MNINNDTMQENFNPYVDEPTSELYSFNYKKKVTNNKCSKICTSCTSCTTHIYNFLFIYFIIFIITAILGTNIYNSYIFTTILRSLHKPNQIELFLNDIHNDYDFITDFLLVHNITFQTIVHIINNSLGLFTNMSHNAFLACKSDLLIPTIDHGKCYYT
jgi:hypothetical protein